MAGLKITFAICLAIATMIHAEPQDSTESSVEVAARSNLLRISYPWFKQYGCPKEGSFKVECNFCHCHEAFATIAACTRMACQSSVIDGWKAGLVSTCEPETEFYSKCSVCTCDKSGTSATCDDRACEFYPDPDGEVTTQVNEV